MPGPKKYHWHGLVHLQWIEFPDLEFHLLKSELNILESEPNILSSLKSEDNFVCISEFIPFQKNQLKKPAIDNK